MKEAPAGERVVAALRCVALSRRLPVRAIGTLEVSLERGAEMWAFDEITMGAFESVLDQLLRSLGVRDASVELCDLALGQATPDPASPAPGGEQPTDLCEREPGVLAEANQRDAFCARGRVVPSLASVLSACLTVKLCMVLRRAW
jgi:hypothetical protein